MSKPVDLKEREEHLEKLIKNMLNIKKRAASDFKLHQHIKVMQVEIKKVESEIKNLKKNK